LSIPGFNPKIPPPILPVDFNASILPPKSFNALNALEIYRKCVSYGLINEGSADKGRRAEVEKSETPRISDEDCGSDVGLFGDTDNVRTHDKAGVSASDKEERRSAIKSRIDGMDSNTLSEFLELHFLVIKFNDFFEIF
jgi:hypothetical protein